MSAEVDREARALRAGDGRAQHARRRSPQHADADRGGADAADGGDHRVPPGRLAGGRRRSSLNWVTWLAFAIELVVMLAVVPEPAHLAPPPPARPDHRRPHAAGPARPACRACASCACSACCACCAWPSSRARSSRCEGLHYAALLAVLTAIGGGALFVALREAQPAPRHLGRDLLGGDDDDHARLEHLPDDDRRRDRLRRHPDRRHRLRRPAHRRLRPALPRPRDRRGRGGAGGRAAHRPRRSRCASCTTSASSSRRWRSRSSGWSTSAPADVLAALGAYRPLTAFSLRRRGGRRSSPPAPPSRRGRAGW